MTIQPLPTFESSLGDKDPWVSMRLADVPVGFHFTDLPVPSGCPLTAARWTELIEYAERYYKQWEINGETVQDWFDNLNLSYLRNADTLERFLEIYDTDLAKPKYGKTETTTYDIHNDTSQSGTQHSVQDSAHVDVATDNVADDTPSQRDSNTGDGTTSGSQIGAQTGTQELKTEDIGDRDNYQVINDFLDNNRTLCKVFTNIFKDNFTLLEVLKW